MRNRRGHATVWPVLVGMLVASHSHAAESPEKIEEVVVTGERISDAEAGAPTAFVTVIDTRESEGVETAADALADSVGVTVRRFGGLGAFSTLSIRGSSPNQVQFYLDGVPLSRARNETVNVADVPLDSLERIEVYRGTAPLGFNNGGIGGVVNLVTKPPTTTPTTYLSSSYGSFSTRKVVASHSQQVDGVDLLGHVTYLGSQGDFRFLDDNGTPANPHDDERVKRQNNQFNSVGGLMRAGTDVSESLRVDLTNETFYKDQGVPGIGSNQSRSASFRALRSLTHLGLRAPQVMGTPVDVSSRLFGIYEQAEFEDRLGELGIGNQNRHDQTMVVGGQSIGWFFAAPAHTVGASIEMSYEQFWPRNELGRQSNEPTQTRLHPAVGLQYQGGFFDERLLVVPTVRYEHVRDSGAVANVAALPAVDRTTDDDLWSPSIGVQFHLWPRLTLRGNFGRYQRVPNFSELFGNRGVVIGNPTLKPETGLNADVGLIAAAPSLPHVDKLEIEHVYFHNDVDDLVILEPSSVGVFKPRNVASARISGHEVTLRGEFFQHLRSNTNFTHQDAEDTGPVPSRHGNQLPGRPRDELYTRVDLFAAVGVVYYEFNYVSGNYLDSVNFRRVPSRDAHTLGITVSRFAPLHLNFEARNVTDNQITDVGGFPLPGRSYFGTATVKF